MKTKILLFITTLLVFTQGIVAAVNTEDQKKDEPSLLFTSSVGKSAHHYICARISQYVITSESNESLIISNNNGLPPLFSESSISSDDYSVSIDGNDSNMFSAVITETIDNYCILDITYSPTAIGKHSARLIIQSASSDDPVFIPLTGKALLAFEPPATHLPDKELIAKKNYFEPTDWANLPSSFTPSNSVIKGADITDIIDWINELIAHAPIIWPLHGSTNYGTYFPDVTVGTTNIGSFKLLGENTKFHRSIHLYKTGSEMFTINKTLIDGASIDKDLGGHEEEVLITYNPTSEGSHKATILLYSGSVLTYPWYTFGWIILKGSAVERHLTASALQSFRTLTVGESDTITIHVEGTNLNGPVTVTLDDHYSNTDMFSINKHSLDPDITGAINDDVKLIYTPTAVGTHGVSVDVSGGGALEVASVVLTGHCEPPTHIITVDHSTLNFGTVVKGETPPSKSFTVTGTNLTNDLVLSLSPECSHYTVSPTRITPNEAANGKPVTVTYHPSAAGTHNIDLKIDEEGMLQGGQLVNLKGKCVANPTITVNTTSLDFETIEVGQEKPMTINVTGTDLTGPITVTKEETHGGQFSISRETLNASGGSVIVTFKPTEAGSFGGCVRISGGGASPVSVTLSGTARELSVTKSSLDFGTIKKGKTETRKFTVYGGNLLGNVTLLSSKPELFEVIPETITPAEAKTGKEVTVIYKPTAGGTHSGKIIVSAEGATNKEVSVSGKCAEIKVNKTALDFETIEVGQEKPMTINVTGTNLTGSISVTKEETHGGQFTISRETLPASGGSVIVTFKPTEAGSFGGRVRISGEGADPVSVSLTGKALELSVYPSSLNLGTTYKNGTLTKKFTVYGGNLTDDVTLSSNKTVFDVSPKKITPAEAKAGKEVTVTFKPTTGGSYSGEITVSASGVTPKKVSVSGKCAVISSNPTSYNFGNVAVGKPVTKEIIVTGTNLTGAMSITLAETEGGQYSINKTTLPASGGTVIVTFKPTDAMSFGASLKISGGSAAAVSISLTGKGVTPTITKNKSTLNFTGSSITSDYVKVSGTNLDDVISLTVTGSTNFTVSPSTISISDAADGKQVKVTCNPKNASSAEAKLKISSPYASTKYVTLKYSRGSSGGGETQICAVEPDGGNEGANNEFMNGGSLEVMSTATTDVNELAMNSKIYAEGLNIIIETPIEQKALLSDIAGHVREVDLQAGRNEIPVNASGVYIVRIREKTVKLMLK